MNQEQYHLIKLAEEASEIAQIALKAAQFGLESVCPTETQTNRQKLFKELNDLMGVLATLNEEHALGFVASTEAIKAKQAKMAKYKNVSISLGLVQPQS